MTEKISLFVISTILAGLTIRFAIPLALTYGILDRPGQHKQHKVLTPFVGGMGILVALFMALIALSSYYPEQSTKWMGLGLGSIIIFIVGFIDDISHLHYKSRLAAQATVILIMIVMGEVILTDLGGLLPGGPLTLTTFAIPFTLFAAIGGINALNMIDGIDGLSGSISLMSLLLLGTVAFIAGDQPSLLLIIALAGGTVGFLFFNLRHDLQPRAKVFLGDNGSMLLGFLIAWLLIDLSQGSDRAMTPVTALWLFSIPLMDTISIMLRRVWQHKSPFEPDHNHLHHILLNAGYRVGDTVFAITSAHLLLGTIGLAGLYLEVPEFVMLLGFLLIFSWYFYLTLHPWHLIMALRYLHTLWGLIPTQSHGVFLGSYTAQEAENLVRMISKELRPSIDSLIHVVKQHTSRGEDENQYVVAVNIRLLDTDDSIPQNETGKFIESLQKRMKEHCGIQLRHLIERDNRNERRMLDLGNPLGNLRKAERRSSHSKLLVFEAMFDRPIPKHDKNRESIQSPARATNRRGYNL